MIWIAVLIFFLVSFTFSGIEAGILSVDRVRLWHREKMGDKDAIKLNRLLSRPERMLVTVLFVTNLMNICAIILSTAKIVGLLGTGGYLVSLLLWLPVYLLGLELLPKSLFRRFPYRALAAFAELLRITDLVLSPLLWIGQRIRRLLLGGAHAEKKKLFIGREDFKYITSESERGGELTKVESEMIHNVVDFSQVTAREVMVPMPQVKTILPETTVDELLGLSAANDLDRFPVVSASGEIAGLVNVVEVLFERTSNGGSCAHPRRIVTVVPDEQAASVIRKLRAARSSLAVVVDPASHPLGIVSLEDLVRRLMETAGSVAEKGKTVGRGIQP